MFFYFLSTLISKKKSDHKIIPSDDDFCKVLNNWYWHKNSLNFCWWQSTTEIQRNEMWSRNPKLLFLDNSTTDTCFKRFSTFFLLISKRGRNIMNVELCMVTFVSIAGELSCDCLKTEMLFFLLFIIWFFSTTCTHVRICVNIPTVYSMCKCICFCFV